MAAFGGAKIWNSKFGCFWRIDVCIADSDIFTPLTLPSFGTIPSTVSAPRVEAVCTPSNSSTVWQRVPGHRTSNSSGGGKGLRVACAPNGTVQGGGIWRGGNMEFETADLTDHSSAVKLQKIDICPVTVLQLAIATQCFALFTCLQILRKIWKCCLKFGHDSQENL